MIQGSQLAPEGLIPARAGKTKTLLKESPTTRAHPRSRGENHALVHAWPVRGGSSPLARGKHVGLLRRLRPYRLIPARAGKTLRASLPVCAVMAHPRLRGENVLSFHEMMHYSGSSPLARGKRAVSGFDDDGRGLIPARAGKTRNVSESTFFPAAHPRSRGENPPKVLIGVDRFGSSPLARGKPRARPHRVCPERLIPARAGKTLKTASIAPVDWAHPRSRGENDRAEDATSLKLGSSPLARGKREKWGHTPQPTRLIPARAGKTTPRERPPARSAAHPRSRGENAKHAPKTGKPLGSSPLARGKPHKPVTQRLVEWLIPARAGKTRRPPAT